MERDTIDVLCIRSSHVHSSIVPSLMWEKDGVTVYDLSEGSQSIWFSYYYLKEALKTQHPKVVMLDTYTVTAEDERFDEKIKANLLYLKPSWNKYQALKASGTDELFDIFLGLPFVHHRIYMMDQEDFAVDGSTLGYAYENQVVIEPSPNMEVIRNVQGTSPISEKSEDYLRRIIRLCNDEDIRLVLINAPWPYINVESKEKYNYAQAIAAEHGVPFIDGCRLFDELGIDCSKDFMGNGGHLNYSGAQKWTDYLLNYLRSHYELEDHRGEERFAEWDEAVNKLEILKAKVDLDRINSAAEYLSYLEEHKNLSYVLMIRHEHACSGSLAQYFDDYGISDMNEERLYAVSIEGKMQRIASGYGSDKSMYKDVFTDLNRSLEGEARRKFLLQYNATIDEKWTGKGILFLVFDPYGFSLLDTVEFFEDQGYSR